MATIVARTCAAIADRLRADRRDVASEGAKNRVPIPSSTSDKANHGMGVDARVSLISEAVPSNQSEHPPQPGGFEESGPEFSAAPARNEFRIQFLGGATGEGPDVVEEAEVCAPNVFEAFHAAEHNPWPPGATGLRILDSRGRNIFWRRKPGTDASYEFHLHLSSENLSADRSHGLPVQRRIMTRSTQPWRSSLSSPPKP